MLRENAVGLLRKYDMRDLQDVLPASALPYISAENQLKALTDQGLLPYEEIESCDNLLMYGGASFLWEAMKGTTLSGGSGATLLVPYSNANAAIGVGESTTAAAATQNNNQGATLTRKAMDATYPTHTDGATSPAASAVFRSTFATSDANIAWNEWALFNDITAGRMFQRKVESLGTKTSSASWQFTITLTLA